MARAETEVKVKRIYEAPDPSDGTRVLVDRLWARGLTKEKAALDLWLKDIAPSTELRKWFSHDPAKWEDFQKRYRAELETNDAAVARLREELRKGPVTLLYAARDQEHNEALVLRDYLVRRSARGESGQA